MNFVLTKKISSPLNMSSYKKKTSRSDLEAAIKYFAPSLEIIPVVDIPDIPFSEACVYPMPYGRYKDTQLGKMVVDSSMRRYLEIQLKWDDIRPNTAGNIASVLKWYKEAKKAKLQVLQDISQALPTSTQPKKKRKIQQSSGEEEEEGEMTDPTI